MKDIFPKTGSEPEWDAACSRLEDYLRALHLADEDQRKRIIQRVLDRVADKLAADSRLCPTALVMAELRAVLARWFQQNLGSNERVTVTGCLAWFALDQPEQCAATFLAEEPPSGFQRRLQACQVRAAPPLRVSSMVPRAFANPLRDAVNLPAPWGKLARNLAPPLAKAATTALSTLSLLSGVRLW